MSELIPDEYKHEFKLNLDGSVSASIRGMARLAGVSHPALLKAFDIPSCGKLSLEGGNQNSDSTLESLVGQGVEGGYLGGVQNGHKTLETFEEQAVEGDAPELRALARFLLENGVDREILINAATKGVPDTIASLILEYYAFEAGRYRTQQAKNCFRAFAAIGIRAWIKGEIDFYARNGHEQHQLPPGKAALKAAEDSGDAMAAAQVMREHFPLLESNNLPIEEQARQIQEMWAWSRGTQTRKKTPPLKSIKDVLKGS